MLALVLPSTTPVKVWGCMLCHPRRLALVQSMPALCLELLSLGRVTFPEYRGQPYYYPSRMVASVTLDLLGLDPGVMVGAFRAATMLPT
jgi:hypothetical protein